MYDRLGESTNVCCNISRVCMYLGSMSSGSDINGVRVVVISVCAASTERVPDNYIYTKKKTYTVQ